MRRAFTLVELMIVVAIIGILAAIAIPNFNQAQLKAKRSEVPLNIEGITTAYLAYDAAYGTWPVQAGFVPDGNFTKAARPWPSSGTGYHTVGFWPDGDVRGGYYSPLYGANGIDTVGRCDVDDNGVNTYYLARIDMGVLLGNNWAVSPPDTF